MESPHWPGRQPRPRTLPILAKLSPSTYDQTHPMTSFSPTGDSGQTSSVTTSGQGQTTKCLASSVSYRGTQIARQKQGHCNIHLRLLMSRVVLLVRGSFASDTFPLPFSTSPLFRLWHSIPHPAFSYLHTRGGIACHTENLGVRIRIHYHVFFFFF